VDVELASGFWWRGKAGTVTGLELLATAAAGYLVRQARRVGERADTEVDRALARDISGPVTTTINPPMPGPDHV
jgi:hypothetical protein